MFDADGSETQRLDLIENAGHMWHGYLPGCEAGQLYGYRIHGIHDPAQGLRCSPSKLLIDPYARLLSGDFAWNEAVFDRNDLDSANYVPKCVVCAPTPGITFNRPRMPWSEMIFYELNVRGYTMLHPDVPTADKGKFQGLTNAKVLDYIKSLGITSVELMPVHAFIDEHHLAKRSLSNYWGYNSISFFAPTSRYAQADALAEFRDMVSTIHDAGIEVVLDVVYNHTGEGDTHGPTLGFRGIDNLAYYSTEPGAPGDYINDTGCGNTINADHPRVQQLILDSLRYWHKYMGVDGFRFDLAPVLGRHNHGYSPGHPLLRAISDDDQLHDAILIAEPWDPGPGGYQLGHFPARWSEWNDRFRDDVRRFWRGDEDTGEAFAERLCGSADIYAASGRKPTASVNMVSSHDGFTLTDVVSYEHRHNEANAEDNKDGHAHNYSCNYGVEGPTDDEQIVAARRRQRLNMLASLLVSQGIPLLLAGDEFGNSQQGNNNAYAQDNETGWLDWSAFEPDFVEQVRSLVQLRKNEPALRMRSYDDEAVKVNWQGDQAFSLLLGDSVSVLVNGNSGEAAFELPGSSSWEVQFSSADDVRQNGTTVILDARSIAVMVIQATS